MVCVCVAAGAGDGGGGGGGGLKANPVACLDLHARRSPDEIGEVGNTNVGRGRERGMAGEARRDRIPSTTLPRYYYYCSVGMLQRGPHFRSSGRRRWGGTE